MNILPKKSWHVRNRDNIARVRKDEAEAAEKQREVERRKKLAEQEAKIKFMRDRTRQQYEIINKETIINDSEPTQNTKSEHVNFFKDLEEGAVVTTEKNKEHEKEEKDQKEKYEKQIGYLTYLGQDTNEAAGKCSWYEKPRADLLDLGNNDEKDYIKKSHLDPISEYKVFLDRRRFTAKPKNQQLKPKCMEADFTVIKKKQMKYRKHKSRKYVLEKRKYDSSHSSSSTDEDYETLKREKLQLLRQQRLKREKEEKIRADQLLAKIRGKTDVPISEPEPSPQFVQKYNSQFNPHLAKQNVY